ncbi:hypothetical protein [Pseudomonas tussilaginis]|uniref:hypothetical protein n=1 Tax=Pseudomonas putida TaxID=303 RepID=UPI0023646836|nr:hypothetical protein [Pseudomonas putida]MDD1977158.1 hypothetical protein [Pseudomonas putida]
MSFDLDDHPGATIKGSVALIAQPARLLVRFLGRAGLELVHVETVAVDVPTVDYGDKASRGLLAALLALKDKLLWHEYTVTNIGHHGLGPFQIIQAM